jgi:hypothetical protein
MHGLLSFIEYFGPRLHHLFCFCKFFLENHFKIFLHKIKAYEYDFEKHFQDLKFLPLFQMFFLWLNKTPPEWNSPFSFQEGSNRYQLEIYLDANFENIPIENHHTNLKCSN